MNILTSMLFGGIQAAARGRLRHRGMLIPAMEKQGYEKDYAVAVTAGSAMLSPIIPPSIAMILYSYYTEVPVGALFPADPGHPAGRAADGGQRPAVPQAGYAFPRSFPAPADAVDRRFFALIMP